MKMSNQEKYQAAFSVLHASAQYSTQKQRAENRPVFMVRRFAAVCACMILMLAGGYGVYALGGQAVREVWGWGNNMHYTETTDSETGETEKQVKVMTESLTDPVEIRNDRLYFIVNGEDIDITGLISETEAYEYEYTDENGNTHYWLVGKNGPETNYYGYGEYIRDADGKWLGGYSARTNLDENGKGTEWLEAGKKKIGFPK